MLIISTERSSEKRNTTYGVPQFVLKVWFISVDGGEIAIAEGTVMKNLRTGGVVNEVEILTRKRKEKAEVEEALVFDLSETSHENQKEGKKY